jgi:hypothetical protein
VNIMVVSLVGLLMLLSMPGYADSQSSNTLDTKAIEQAIGKPGELKEDVYKISLPRKDLSVSVKGIELKPGFALGSWIAVKQAGKEAVCDGDLVLTEKRRWGRPLGSCVRKALK